MTHSLFTDGILNAPRLFQYSVAPQIMFERFFSPNNSGMLEPQMILVHYTGGGDIVGTTEWCCDPESKVSYHFLIERDGRIRQLVSCERCASHAGKSEWEGLTGLNKYSVGIGLCNFGPLVRNDKSGMYHPADENMKNFIIPSRNVQHTPILAPVYSNVYWERYQENQLYALALLVHAICSSFHILELLGHSDVSPGRKIDPGPVFPLDAFRAFAAIKRP